MSQTNNTVTPSIGPKGPSPRIYFTASMYSNDADTTGNLTVKAAPSSGNLYIEHVIVLADADCGSWTLSDDAAALIGPVEVTATEMAHGTSIPFLRPAKLTGALKIDCNANAVINVIAQGYSV